MRTRHDAYVHAPGLVSETIDQEVVILDPRGGKVHQLNGTASRIWEWAHTGDVADIATRVAALFVDAPPVPRVAEDVAAALAQFERLGLLVRVEGDSGQ